MATACPERLGSPTSRHWLLCGVWDAKCREIRRKIQRLTVLRTTGGRSAEVSFSPLLTIFSNIKHITISMRVVAHLRHPTLVYSSFFFFFFLSSGGWGKIKL